MIEAMLEGTLGLIDTPNQRNEADADLIHAAGGSWCADNGAFSEKFDEAKWWAFLQRHAHRAATCAFAVAPDVVGDAAATLERSLPWLPKIRALDYPVAYVAQDGFDPTVIPWSAVDCLFIGGTDLFKLGPAGRDAVREAKARGKWVHLGRCNSEKRWRYAEAIGCGSVDGTFLRFGPTVNLPRLMTWLRSSHQHALEMELP